MERMFNSVGQIPQECSSIMNQQLIMFVGGAYMYMYVFINHDVNRIPGESSLEWILFPGCMSSVRYFVSQFRSMNVDW